MILKTGLKGGNDVQNTLWSTENMKRPTAILFAILLSVLALASCSDSNSATAGMSVPANPGSIYRIITLNEAGTPVEGVKVQFCSDILCITGDTDANGMYSFPGATRSQCISSDITVTLYLAQRSPTVFSDL